MSYSSTGEVNISFNAVDRLSAVMQSIGQNAQSFITSINGVAQSVVSLSTGFTRVMDSSVYVDRALLMVEKSARALKAAEDALSTAISKFGPNSDQANKAATDLAIAQDQLQVSEERAKLATDNQRATIMQFAVSVIPAAVSAVANLTTAMEAMGIASTACLGPIGLIVVGITALTTAITYMASHWTPTFHDMSADVVRLKLETDKMVASTEAMIQKFNEGATATDKLAAAYLEWYSLVKGTNEEFSKTLSDITEEYNVLQAQGSDVFKGIALDYQKAFATGNLDLAAGFLMSIKTGFKVTLSDAKRLVDDFLTSLAGTEIPAITIPGVTMPDLGTSLFDQLANQMNLDKATELAKKYVDRFRTAWDEGSPLLAMMLAGQLANEAKISVDDAIKLLERLKDAAQAATDAITTTIDPLTTLADKLQTHWLLDAAQKIGDAFVAPFTKAWNLDNITDAMAVAAQFAKAANISLENALNILDELMNKAKGTVEKGKWVWNTDLLSYKWSGPIPEGGPPATIPEEDLFGYKPPAITTVTDGLLQSALAAVQALKRLLYVPTMAEGGIVTRPSLIMAGEAGPEAIIPLDRGAAAPILQINSPLITVEGSVDKHTADYLVGRLEKVLSNVLIEPSSSSGSSTHKRIRIRG